MKTKSEFKNHLAARVAVLLLCLVAAHGPAQNCTVLHDFGQGDGSWPRGNLALSGGTLYGMTGSGSVYKVETNGANFTVLQRVNFTYTGVALSGDTLY